MFVYKINKKGSQFNNDTESFVCKLKQIQFKRVEQ